MSKLMKDIIEVTLIAKDEVKQAKIPKALLEDLVTGVQTCALPICTFCKRDAAC